MVEESSIKYKRKMITFKLKSKIPNSILFKLSYHVPVVALIFIKLAYRLILHVNIIYRSRNFDIEFGQSRLEGSDFLILN